MPNQLSLPIGSVIENNFLRFHEDNPMVYRLFCRLARLKRRQGFRKYGIKAIAEVVRFRHDVRPDANERYKFNNNYTAYYARLIMRKEPDLRGFFNLRELRTPANSEEIIR